MAREAWAELMRELGVVVEEEGLEVAVEVDVVGGGEGWFWFSSCGLWWWRRR